MLSFALLTVLKSDLRGIETGYQGGNNDNPSIVKIRP